MNPFSIQHIYLVPKTYEIHKITSKSTKIHYIMEEEPHSTKQKSNPPHQMEDTAKSYRCYRTVWFHPDSSEPVTTG
jgi:hypothetical protein